MRLPPQTVVDQRYEIISSLGEGGMSVVYKARQLQLDRIVALKLLRDGVGDDTEEKARLQREAVALNAINHTGIIGVYGFGFWHGFPYVVMEYVDGDSLQSLLQNKEPLPPERVLSLMLQLCSALGKAHASGIVHRDLKPSNIMLVDGPDGETVKVIDFGLARVLPGFGPEVQRLTEAGNALGSVLYMSPEQCVGEDADRRSDIYSLGIILHQCLAGVGPFAEVDNAVAVMHGHVHLTPRALPSSLQLPAGWQGVIYRALAKRPDDRYQSADDMAADLLAIREGNGQNIASYYKVPDGGIAPAAGEGRLRHHAVGIVVSVSIIVLVAGSFCAHLYSHFWSHPGLNSVELYLQGSKVVMDDDEARKRREGLLERALSRNAQDHLMEPYMVMQACNMLAAYYDSKKALPILLSAMRMPKFHSMATHDRCGFYRNTAQHLLDAYLNGRMTAAQFYALPERHFLLDMIDKEWKRSDDEFTKSQLLVDLALMEPNGDEVYKLFQRLKKLSVANELSLYPAVDMLRAYRRTGDGRKHPERIKELLAFADHCAANQGRVTVDMYESVAQIYMEQGDFPQAHKYASFVIGQPAQILPETVHSHIVDAAALACMGREAESNLLIDAIHRYATTEASAPLRYSVTRAMRTVAGLLASKGKKAAAEKINQLFPEIARPP